MVETFKLITQNPSQCLVHRNWKFRKQSLCICVKTQELNSLISELIILPFLQWVEGQLLGPEFAYLMIYNTVSILDMAEN